MQGIAVSFHLCLSAATRVRDCMSMAAKFGEVRPDALIFTKLDESRGLGMLYSTVQAGNLPVSHVCNGPIVPEDIQSATPGEVAGWAYHGTLRGADEGGRR